MKKTKQVLSFLFALLILAMATPQAFAADIIASGTCGPNATWSINSDRVLTIKGTGAITANYGVYSDSNNYGRAFDHIVIENGITEISSSSAFSMKGVRLASITIPPSLKRIADETICETEFDSVYISDLAAWCSIVHDGINTNPVWKGDLYLNGTLVAGDFVFPNTISTLNSGTFYSYSGFKSVTIPGTVKTVGSFAPNGGYGAFDECENLERVVLQPGVQTIGVSAFCYCPKLSSVELPDSLQTIQSGAFLNCPNLKQIELPQNIQSIQTAAFYESGLTEVKIWNPSCELSDDYIIEPHYDWEEEETLTVFPNGITIYGYKNSTAEAYATAHNCRFIELQTHTHDYTSAVTTPATCTEKGLMTYTCSCGNTYTKEIPIDPDAHAALDENGDCMRCGKHIKDVEKPADKPTDEKPAEKLNFFQRILQWFRNLFAKLFGR